MHYLIAWSGFLGAWLLVAGPIQQAAIELEEEGFERDEIAAVAAVVPPRPRRSPWWWLLPPVAYAQQRRESQARRQQVMAVMEPEQRQRFVRLANKATGWLFVATGAFFIAVKETWELHELYEWPLWVFWAVLVVMLLVAASNTVVRIRRSHAMVATDPPSGSAPSAAVRN